MTGNYELPKNKHSLNCKYIILRRYSFVKLQKFFSKVVNYAHWFFRDYLKTIRKNERHKVTNSKYGLLAMW